MEEGLHGDLLGEIGEERHAVVGTVVSTGIAEWRHTVGEVEHAVEALDASTSGGEGR